MPSAAPINRLMVPTAGAIQALLPDPGTGREYTVRRSPNGGIWVTNNFGTTWTPLTDNQGSLSIASLGLDPTDPSGKTIIAASVSPTTANTANSTSGPYQGRGGAQTGLLYTTNGGATWSTLGTTSAFAGESVIGVVARGNTLLAATYGVQNATGPTATYGLFRSTDDGQRSRKSPAAVLAFRTER